MNAKIKKVLGCLIMLALVISFIPVAGISAYADGAEPRVHVEGCLLVEDHEGVCLIPAAPEIPDEEADEEPAECQEGCILDGPEEHAENGGCYVPAPCTKDSTCILMDGHEGECVPDVAVYESANSGTWGGIDWVLDDNGTLTISPTKGTPVPDPNSGKSFAVGEWREAVVYNSAGDATAVGGYPYVCDNVKNLIIKEGVTYIGSFVAKFKNLTGEVVIPSTVTYIGQEAFQNAPINKLTFAKGGTEKLCIAPGAFKALQITELVLPADRSEIHIHCWAFLGCSKLKEVSFPANVTTFSGWTHVDYCGLDYTNGWDSQVLSGCNSLEVLSFEDETVKTKFYGGSGNQNNTKQCNTAHVNGLIYCASVEAAAKHAESGDTITLMKDTEASFVLPSGVQLDTNGKSAPDIISTLQEAVDNYNGSAIQLSGKIHFDTPVNIPAEAGEVKINLADNAFDNDFAAASGVDSIFKLEEGASVRINPGKDASDAELEAMRKLVSKNYCVYEGSIVIADSHDLKSDGTCDVCGLQVVSNTYEIPVTADTSHLSLWLFLFMAFSAIAVLTRKRRA